MASIGWRARFIIFSALCLAALAGSPARAATVPCVGIGPADEAEEGIACVFDFDRGREGWQGGFADLPAGEVKGGPYGLRFARVPLPPYLGRQGAGLLLAGTNRSDDLVLFVARPITGLAPSTRYAVRYKLRLASDAGAGCAGTGGAPGESVYVKAGASTRRPVPVERDGFLRLPIDIGNQSQGGADAKVLGDVAVPDLGCGGLRFGLATRDGADRPTYALTDRRGTLWLFVGLDSGYEGRTRVILDRIEVVAARVRR